MSRKVTVEELREKLEEILAEVKGGESITLIEDGRSIASVTPADIRSVNTPFREFVRTFDAGPRPKNLTADVVELIREDRDSEFRKYGR
jgi:antitoxin (DNA-binding transcriptional repressor) of toxin-antitoxin stability system